MTRTQHSLFDDCAIDRPRARRSDPSTSKAAARSMQVAAETDHAEILAVLRGSSISLSAEQIADAIGHGDSVRVCRRLAELERGGRIAVAGITAVNRSGRRARCWGVVG